MIFKEEKKFDIIEVTVENRTPDWYDSKYVKDVIANIWDGKYTKLEIFECLAMVEDKGGIANLTNYFINTDWVETVSMTESLFRSFAFKERWSAVGLHQKVRWVEKYRHFDIDLKYDFSELFTDTKQKLEEYKRRAAKQFGTNK